jgi:hypothetical protein
MHNMSAPVRQTAVLLESTETNLALDGCRFFLQHNETAHLQANLMSTLTQQKQSLIKKKT